MSSDERLKRLGLDHLKNDSKALKEKLDQLVQDNEQQELLAMLEQLEALKAQQTTQEDREAIDAKIKAIRAQYRKP